MYEEATDIEVGRYIYFAFTIDLLLCTFFFFRVFRASGYSLFLLALHFSIPGPRMCGSSIGSRLATLRFECYTWIRMLYGEIIEMIIMW